MSMSRKNYGETARILHDAANDPTMDLVTLSSVAGALANYFESDNERFDRARFMKACFTGTSPGYEAYLAEKERLDL